jgi:hypothetical protein
MENKNLEANGKNEPRGYYKLTDKRWVRDDSVLAILFGGNTLSDILTLVMVAPFVCFVIWPHQTGAIICDFIDWLSVTLFGVKL